MNCKFFIPSIIDSKAVLVKLHEKMTWVQFFFGTRCTAITNIHIRTYLTISWA